MEKNPKFNNRRASYKAVGPGKKYKIINIGPTFIPDYRVHTLDPNNNKLLSCSIIKRNCLIGITSYRSYYSSHCHAYSRQTQPTVYWDSEKRTDSETIDYTIRLKYLAMVCNKIGIFSEGQKG